MLKARAAQYDARIQERIFLSIHSVSIVIRSEHIVNHRLSRSAAFLLSTALSLTFAAQTSLAACTQAPPEDESKPRSLTAELGVYPYEPIYFIAGANGGMNAKFQISFKYKIFSETGIFSRCLHAPTNVYLSYSQTSLWDLDVLSSPFRDTSYRPRLFYYREDLWTPNERFQMGLETGVAHESNGKADPGSRSINTYYARPTLSYYIGEKNRVYFAPMVFGYIDKSTENENIADYRGHVELLVGYARGKLTDVDFNAWATLRKGDASKYGSIELNIAVPWRYAFDNMNGWFLMQYFSGHGESLLDYDRKLTSQFRAGFAIVVQ
jgi:phospholipase A1/A2